MVRHPLDGAKLKVVRAQKHLQSLKNEIATYLNTNPYEIPIENDGDEMIIRAAVIRPGCDPPEELSCIVSECIGSLRSALDYIAWELAMQHAVVPPSSEKTRASISLCWMLRSEKAWIVLRRWQAITPSPHRPLV